MQIMKSHYFCRSGRIILQEYTTGEEISYITGTSKDIGYHFKQLKKIFYMRLIYTTYWLAAMKRYLRN